MTNYLSPILLLLVIEGELTPKQADQIRDEVEVLDGIDFKEVAITYLLVEVNLRDYSLSDMDGYLGGFSFDRIDCLSGFTEEMKGWDGNHQDYLYKYMGT